MSAALELEEEIPPTTRSPQSAPFQTKAVVIDIIDRSRKNIQSMKDVWNDSCWVQPLDASR